jgi:ABC-type branched-subunit amino acid transport system substrate-binding protein
VIYSDDGFDSEATAEGFISACNTQNIVTTPIRISSRATQEDVIRSVRDVSAGKYDVIFLALSPEYTRIFMEEFVGANETILTSRLPDGGLNRESILVISSYFGAGENEVIRNFISTYEETYGIAPDSYAADAYDAVYAIAQAIKRAGITPDGNEKNWSAELQKAMTEIEVRGVTGNISWTTDGESTRASEVRIFREGSFVPFGQEEPSDGT